MHKANEEMRQTLFESNVSAAREENKMQDMYRVLERERQAERDAAAAAAQENIALRARRKELVEILKRQLQIQLLYIN